MRWTTLTIAGLTLAADLASKTWARTSLFPGNTIRIVPGLLQVTLTTNTGAAFGVGRDAGGLMTWVALAILIALIIWVVRRERSPVRPGRVERAGMGFLIGGALGNLWERLTVGRVTDFLEFTFVSFPVFNLADMAIDLGAALILLRWLDRSPVCLYASTRAEKASSESSGTAHHQEAEADDPGAPV